MDDVGAFVALVPFVNVAPLRCDHVNSTVASVVCLGGCCVRVGGVEVLDRMEGQGGGGGFFTAGGFMTVFTLTVL